MTDIAADIKRLRACAVIQGEIAQRFASMVPESDDGTGNILAASNAAYAAKSRSNDAATLAGWAIAEQMGGE